MYDTLLGLHSGLRYIVLVLLALALLLAIIGLFGKKAYTETNRKVNLFAMIFTHTQFLVGLILYFFSPQVNYANMAEAMKNVLMLFAIILITIGHSRSKKTGPAFNKHRSIALYYGLAILVIVVAIYQSGRPLFGMS